MQSLKVTQPSRVVRATEHIDAMISMIKEIMVLRMWMAMFILISVNMNNTQRYQGKS